MDLSRIRRSATSASGSLVELPEYIITSFLPGARPLLDKYPRLFRFLGVLLALWYFGPLARLQTLWSRFSSILVASISVSSEEDLFGYVTTYIAERKTLRADHSLNAVSSLPQENRRRRHDPDFEEASRKNNEDPKIKYEQGQGMQFFVHEKRLFYITRKYGDGHTYYGNRYKRTEILTLLCLGRSTQPIKDLLEHVYFLNKDKERALTIIRRPYTGGYGSRLTWSRLASKPRRALDTVILDGGKKDQVITDVEEYMDEATMAFYANHGIPYRRGYLFYGPPGTGKSSFALALASRFNLDVYNLTLLDQDLTDSDLISLLNQLPGRSLLLLEDIDTAGLSRKGKGKSTARRAGGRRQPRLPVGAVSADDNADLDGDDNLMTTSRVTLSGLLNAIDGVAAPEGHILVLTTNKYYALDDALVRAGRISVRVDFQNASKQQAEEIFLRMYVDLPSTSHPWQKKSETQKTPTTTTKVVVETTTNPKDETHLRSLAKKFADLIPDHDFSPADLQDYLLIHKKDADKAVEGLQEWMNKEYEERRKKDEEIEAEGCSKPNGPKQLPDAVAVADAGTDGSMGEQHSDVNEKKEVNGGLLDEKAKATENATSANADDESSIEASPESSDGSE